MSLTVLSVAYPLAAVGLGAVGGAEQVLTQLDRALVGAGHTSIVIACEGSQTAGAHVAVPRVAGDFDTMAVEEARECHRRAIVAALQRWPVDLVHFHGVDFHSYLPPAGVPVLATLHLPVSCYPREALFPRRPDTWLHCVSAAQHATCAPHSQLLPPIENGVAVGDQEARHAKRRFALMLSRICPEKGVHLAIDAAKRAEVPLLIAGQVYPYAAHRRYFETEVEPRLDRWRRFIGPVAGARKSRLLAAARCLLVPSLVPETSSLATREALAAGTPVVAFTTGALAETVEDGRTGFMVRDVAGMAEAIHKTTALRPEACREAARRRFSLHAMVQGYFATYAALCRQEARAPTAVAS